MGKDIDFVAVPNPHEREFNLTELLQWQERTKDPTTAKFLADTIKAMHIHEAGLDITADKRSDPGLTPSVHKPPTLEI